MTILEENLTKKCQNRIVELKLIFCVKIIFFFEKFVITVIFFGKLAETFSSSKNVLSSYGVDFILEPLQRANYALGCGSYDEMVDFRQFFPTLIRHISTPMTSWQKIFCMRVALSYSASHKKFRPNACGYLQGCR